MRRQKISMVNMILHAALILIIFAGAGTVKAEHGRMILVLDASGSMWGQIDGKPKITIAKEVMAELIAAVPADFETGLIVYGHRKKGDCQDIEMMIPVGPHNAAAMTEKIKSINPKGKTPLSESVRQAAQALRYTEEKATVVLVSDGLETCGTDPCALAAELAMSGVDFTVHVIGFDIGKEDQERLRCMADRTGGLFLTADNASSLRDALFKTLEEVQAPPPPVVEDPGKAVLTGPASVPAGSRVSVQWEGPDSRDDYIAISEKGSKDLDYAEYAYTKSGNPVVFTAPGKIGDYELRYVHNASNTVIGRADIKVTPVEARLQAPESADVAAKIEVSWEGPAYPGDFISIALPDQPSAEYTAYTYTRNGTPLKVQAPSEPGDYEIRYIMGKDNSRLAMVPISIKGVGAEIDAPPVADVATQISVNWKGPGNEPDYISIAKPDLNDNSYIHYTYTRTGNPVKLQMPSDPGDYEIRYVLGQGEKVLASAPISVKAVDASVDAPAETDVASKIDVSWQGPGNDPDYISIARPDQNDSGYVHFVYTRTGNPVKLQMPPDPGSYEIRYILGHGEKKLAGKPITVKAVSASVDAPAEADVASKIDVSWQGPGNEPDYISIARPDQNDSGYVHFVYTRTGNPVKLQMPPEPGSYEIRYILGHGEKKLTGKPITLKPVTAVLSVPTTASAGEMIAVTWEGPGYDPDFISVSEPGQSAGAYLSYAYARNNNPAKLKMPEKAGTYEVRYIMGHGNKLLDKKTISVK